MFAAYETVVGFVSGSHEALEKYGSIWAPPVRT